MSESWTDPGWLEGDALQQWYLRSPADVERGRQEAAARRYQDFFYGGADNDPGRQFDGSVSTAGRGIDPGFAIPAPSGDTDPVFAMSPPPSDIDPGFTWIATGPNRWRGARTATDGQPTDARLPAIGFDNDASSTDGGLRSNVSYRSPTSAPPVNSGLRPAGRQAAQSLNQQPPIDPSKTPVFQTGPDGKLHPVPGWRTTGPFDFGAWSHNIHWGGVAKDLGEIAAGIPAFFSGVGAGADLLAALGPEAETAVAEGIAESPAARAAAKTVHRHHVDPKYMGGAEDGETVDLEGDLHQEFHRKLEDAHREEGFPPRGGINGSRAKWGVHYERNPGRREQAYEILRRVARKFDEEHGTNISSRLPPPSTTEAGLPPPQ